MNERYLRLGLKAYQGSKAEDCLLEKGMAKETYIATGTGRTKLLELTGKGRKALDEAGGEMGKSHRNGGLEDELWKARLAQALSEEGFQGFQEMAMGQGDVGP